MLLYLANSSTAYSLSRVFPQQLVDEVCQQRRPSLGQILSSEVYFSPQHFFPDFRPVLALKWPPAHGQLVYYHSQCVEIRLIGVIALEEDFRSHIDGSAAGLIASVAGFVGFLAGNAEVSDSHIAALFKHDIFGLEVLVDDLIGVDVLQSD